MIGFSENGVENDEFFSLYNLVFNDIGHLRHLQIREESVEKMGI